VRRTRIWAARSLSTRATCQLGANGQKFLYKDGPERQAYSDPDASWGHRSAVSTRKGGGFYGYRIHAAVCASTGLPLAWQVQTARSHESMHVAPLLDAVAARGYQPGTAAMDMGYDNGRIYAECAERNVVPIIPLRKNQGHRESSIPRKSDEWRSLYRRRSAVEREFGNHSTTTASRSCGCVASSGFGSTRIL